MSLENSINKKEFIDLLILFEQMKINRVLSVSQCYKFTLYCMMVFKLRYILQQMKINYTIRWRFFLLEMNDRNYDYIVVFEDKKIEQMKIKEQANITFS